MTPDERRLLELPAGSADGATDALLRAHGFTVALMIDVVRAGDATARAERTFATGGRSRSHGCGSRKRYGGTCSSKQKNGPR
jgi:hypothetical protein